MYFLFSLSNHIFQRLLKFKLFTLFHPFLLKSIHVFFLCLSIGLPSIMSRFCSFLNLQFFLFYKRCFYFFCFRLKNKCSLNSALFQGDTENMSSDIYFRSNQLRFFLIYVNYKTVKHNGYDSQRTRDDFIVRLAHSHSSHAINNKSQFGRFTS